MAFSEALIQGGRFDRPRFSSDFMASAFFFHWPQRSETVAVFIFPLTDVRWGVGARKAGYVPCACVLAGCQTEQRAAKSSLPLAWGGLREVSSLCPVGDWKKKKGGITDAVPDFSCSDGLAKRFQSCWRESGRKEGRQYDDIKFVSQGN